MDLGELKLDLTKVITDNIGDLNKTIASNHLEQTTKINDVTTQIAVFKEHCDNRCEITDKEFSQLDKKIEDEIKTVDGKLANDFADIKSLKDKSLKQNGVEEWKGKGEKRLRFAFFIIISFFSLVFAIDKINDLICGNETQPTKVEYTKPDSTGR